MLSGEMINRTKKIRWISVFLLIAGTGISACVAVAQDEKIKGVPFAYHGTEKMIYDLRQGPQALWYKDVIYIVYQADRTKNIGNPHITSYDTKREKWSESVQVGTVPKYDHHYAPIV